MDKDADIFYEIFPLLSQDAQDDLTLMIELLIRNFNARPAGRARGLGKKGAAELLIVLVKTGLLGGKDVRPRIRLTG